MRDLRPSRLIERTSGLWAVDDVQPVAAVLDPLTGDVRRIVSWRDLPPAPLGESGARVLGDGTSLWTQQTADGPLLRVGLDGVATAAWTGGLMLAACGPGVAWCAPDQPPQELVQGADASPADEPGPDRLLRVSADGRCTRVHTQDRVRSVQAEPEGLLIEVDAPPWTLQHRGANSYEVSWATRWLRLPLDAEVPEAMTLDSHGVPDTGSAGAPEPIARYDDGGRLYNHWYDATSDPDDPDVEPVAALGLRWHLGWSRWSPGDRQNRQSRRVEASAHDSHGLVRHWDLGEGTVLAAAPSGARLAVAVARSARSGPQGPGPVDVLALNPAQSRVIVLVPPGSIDITEQCWPLVPRPLDADSYTARVLAANDDIEHFWHGPDGITPLAGGLSQARTSRDLARDPARVDLRLRGLPRRPAAPARCPVR